ncbi:MAG TPA: hypothetical protein VHF89_19040 [Solirubrobacteraceae bacterium]|nr:hypothetical protein [Solirubrobacteraceae bacterium]
MPAIALTLLALGGCGEDERDGSGGEENGCTQTLLWRGADYFPDEIAVARSGVVGRGVLPACMEREDREVAVLRLARTPPAVAVAVPGFDDVWLAAGFPLELAEHPLHAKRYGRGRPTALEECRRRERLRGAVAVAPAPVSRLHLAIDGRRVPVRLHARTAVVGLRRAGVPYLPEGARVVADVRRCASSTTVVADALRPG